MATIKLTLDSRRAHSDGRFPIIYRLTSNSKSTSIESGVRLLSKEWDSIKGKISKNHPEYKTLNYQLTKKLYEFEKKLIELNSESNPITLAELKNILLNRQKLVAETLFQEFAVNEIQQLKKQERFGNAQSYETAVNRLLKFAGNSISLNQINYTLIVNFELHLLEEGLTKNSVAVYMREIRALLNKAIKKELMDKNKYPFTNYKIRTEKTISRAITKDDLIKIRNFQLIEGTKLWHSRNMFFLIFNLIGISFMDLALLTHENIQHGRIVYKRRKTGTIYSIKLTSEAIQLFEMYKGNSKYIVDDLKLETIAKVQERTIINQKLKNCNKYLKNLGKLCELPIPLTTYVARYTWANIAKSIGYPKDQIAEALGHEYGNRVTGIYLDNYGNEVIDEMNEKVTGCFVNI